MIRNFKERTAHDLINVTTTSKQSPLTTTEVPVNIYPQNTCELHVSACNTMNRRQLKNI